MPYTLGQAATAAARDRSTILRAIKSGKLSGLRDPVTKGWLIEPSELHRLYPALQGAEQRNADAQALLQAKFDAAQEKIAMLERTVEDLRRRLDIATAQLGEALQQVRLLTDQRAARRRWWRW